MRNLPVVWRRTFGVIMIALGSYLLVQMYVLHNPPRIGPQSVATIFALFFILRGALYLRMARTRIKPDTP